MHKHAKMIYGILEGYMEGFDIQSVYVMSINQTCETFDKRIRAPRTVIDLKFSYKADDGLSNEGCGDITIDVSLWVERKYLYRALHDFKQKYNIRHNISDTELLRALGLATPPTPWEVLVRETEDK
jgi:hypothetical protein